MQLTEQQIVKFQTLYLQKLGENISYDQSLDMGLKLVQLFKQVYKPISIKEKNENIARRKLLNG